MTNEINLMDMTIKSSIRLMMEKTEYDQFQNVAKELDIAKSTFQSALDNESMRVRDLKKVADLLGYELTLTQK